MQCQRTAVYQTRALWVLLRGLSAGDIVAQFPRRSSAMAPPIDVLEGDLAMWTAVAVFMGISWYISVEVILLLFLTFKRCRGLYFWSCFASSSGVLLSTLSTLLQDFAMVSNPRAIVVLAEIAWALSKFISGSTFAVRRWVVFPIATALFTLDANFSFYQQWSKVKAGHCTLACISSRITDSTSA
jgi:hypothetical protein